MEFTFTKLQEEEFAFRHMDGEKVLAEISWTMLGDVMAIEHTFVAPELRGKGVAKQLVDRAAAYAREEEYRMEPICSYVVTLFERSDAYDDVKA